MCSRPPSGSRRRTARTFRRRVVMTSIDGVGSSTGIAMQSAALSASVEAGSKPPHRLRPRGKVSSGAVTRGRNGGQNGNDLEQ